MLAPEAAQALLAPLLDGLAQLHAAGLIHRDIKPANIWLRRSGGPLLLDFGAARAPGTDQRLTAVLSPGYAPPEQYTEDGFQGPHTDVYALGAVLYRVLTGREPVDAYTRSVGDNAARRHSTCAEAAPAGLAPAWGAVVDRAMALDIRARYADVPALRAAMARASGHAITLPETGPAPCQAAPLPTGVAPSDAGQAASNQVRTRRGCAITFTIAISFAGLGLIVLPQLRQQSPPAIASTTTGAAPTQSPPPPEDAGPVADAPMPVAAAAPPELAPPVVEPVAATPLAPLPPIIAELRAALPAAELAVEVLVAPRQPFYLEGEELEIGYRFTQEGAYAAVFVHGQDGAVLLLSPDDPKASARSPAAQLTWVQIGAERLRLRIAPPFGAETIHVLGFRQRRDLERLLEGLVLQRLGPSLWLVDPASLQASSQRLGSSGMAPWFAWGDALQAVPTRAR